MRISSEAWAKYQRAHAMLQGEAKQLLEEFFDSLPWDEDEQGCLALLAQRAVELFNHYGLADATLSAAFYDEVMEMQGANVPQAVIPEHDTRYVERDVRGACERAKTRETAKSMSSAALSGHVKRAGVETMRANAMRDRAMWAWVCIGDSCAFCRTLGSNGWQQVSEAVLAGNHAEHIHDNCDCQFVVKKPGETLDIEGYDPDALRKEYEAAGAGSARDHINAMRRADYTPEEAAERNARRRELYAQQKAEERNERIRTRTENAHVIGSDLYDETPEVILERAKKINEELDRIWYGNPNTGTSKAAYRTYADYVSSMSVNAPITIEDFAKIEGKELQIASWFSSIGVRVHFRNHNRHNNKSDVTMYGMLFDFKRVTSPAHQQISTIVKKKLKTQGPGFVVDLSTSEISLDDAIMECAHTLERERVERMLIIKDAQLIEVRK